MKIRKLVSVVLLLTLNFTSSFGNAISVFAQEEITPEPTPVVEQTVAPTSEPTTEPTTEPTIIPTEQPTVAPTIEITIEPTAVPTEQPTLAPTLEPTVAPIETITPTAEVSSTPSPTSEPTVEPTKATETNEVTWQNVQVGTTYQYKDTKVKVTFTKITNPGDLRIKEVKLSDEQKSLLNTTQNIAYDITSSMKNGEFEYTLQLPNPQPGRDTEVKYSENGKDFTELSEGQDTSVITLAGLDHFTLFVVVNTPPTPNALQRIVDNTDSDFQVVSGNWRTSTSIAGYYGTNYRTTDDRLGTEQVKWNLTSQYTGTLNVSARWTAAANRNANAKFTVTHDGGSSDVFVNQKLNNATWISLGNFSFTNGTTYSVTLTNTSTTVGSDFVIADAVKWEKVTAPSYVCVDDAWTASTNGTSVSGCVGNYVIGYDAFSSIQDAINQVATSGTVFVMDGNYGDPLTTIDIDKTLTLEGQSQAVVVSVGNTTALNVTANNVTIKNITVSGNGDGINFTSVNGGTVENCVIDNNTFTPSGIYIVDSTNITLNNNIFSNNSVALDIAGTSSNITVSNSTFTNNLAYDVLNDTTNDVYASLGNDWGTTDYSQIQTKIYDQNDLGTLGLVIIDTTSPTIPALIVPSDGAVKKPVNLILDWADSTDAFTPLTYQYQSATTNTVGANNALSSPIYLANMGAATQIDASGTGDGVYYWQVRACDAANNCSDWSGPWAITVDSVNPSVTFTDNVSAGPVQSEDITITVTDTNPDTLTYAYGFSTDTTCDASDTYGTTFTSGSAFTLTTETNNGQYVCARASDLAGNIGYSAASANVVNIDASVATPSNITPPDNTFITTANLTSIGWDAVTDPNGPVVYVYQSAYDLGFTSIAYTSGDLATNSIATSGTPENVYYVRVLAKDAVGNTSAWSTPVKITVDNTPPLGTVTVGTATLSDGDLIQEVTVTYTEDMLSSSTPTITFGATTGTWTPGVGSWTSTNVWQQNFTLTDANETVSGVTATSSGATDLAGNIEASSTAATFNIDTLTPILTTVSISPAYVKNGNTITLNFTSSETITTPTVTILGQSATVSNLGGNTWQATYTTVGTETEGVVTFTIDFSDTLGNVGTQVASTTDSSSTIYDRMAPLTVAFGIDSNWHNTDQTVTFVCGDGGSGSGCATTYYTTDGTTPTTASASGSSVVLTLDGSYTIKYFSVDNAGNQEAVYTEALPVKIDKTNPFGSWLAPLNNAYLRGVVTLDATDAGDALSGVRFVRFRYDPLSTPAIDYVTIFQDTASPFSYLWNTLTGPQAVADGQYRLRARIQDRAGNFDLNHITITIDNTAPTFSSVNIVSNNANPLYARTGNVITVTFTASETIQTPTVSILGHSVSATNTSGNIWTASYTTVGADPQGLVALNIAIADLAGNPASTTSTTDSSQVTFDRTQPTATNTSDAGTWTNNAQLTFTWPAATDAITAVSHYRFYLNTSPVHSAPTPLINGKNIGNVLTYTLTPAEAALLTSGTTYYAKVRAVDMAGNQRNTGNFSDGITLDLSLPTSSITAPVAGYYNATSWPTIAGTATDTISGVNTVEVSLDNSIWNAATGTNNWTYTYMPIVDGTVNIYSRATDLAGNVQSPVASTSGVIYDNTPPTGSWVSPTNGQTVSGNSVALSTTTNDNLSGVASVQYQYKATSNSSYTNIATSTWDTTGLPLGTYNLRAVVTDNAGNITNLDETVYIAAVITSLSGNTIATDKIQITWTTDRPTDGRVLFDTVSQSLNLSLPNYGYAFTTGTVDTNPNYSTSHSIIITGLSAETNYFWRVVSSGAPTIISLEQQNKTFRIAGNCDGGCSTGSGGGTASAPVAAAQAPANNTAGFVVQGGGEVAGAFTENIDEEELSATPTPTQTSDTTPTPTPEVKGASTQDYSYLWWWLLIILAIIMLLIGWWLLRKNRKEQ